MNAAVDTGGWSGLTDRRVLGLAALDVLVVAGLVIFGQLSHGTNPLAEPLGSVETVLPFVIGWLVVSPLAGVYARAVVTSVRRSARTTAVAWIAAANVGIILRSSPLFDGTAEWAFPLVITGTGLVALVGWRVLYATFADSAAQP